jgi:hypothetical protein
MRVEDDDLLAEFRKPGCCECCGRPCPDGRDPAHLLSRGAGRVDIRENLASLRRECHTSSHGGNSPRVWRLFIIVARREGTTPRLIWEKIQRIRRDSRKVWNVAKDGPLEAI